MRKHGVSGHPGKSPKLHMAMRLDAEKAGSMRRRPDTGPIGTTFKELRDSMPGRKAKD